MKPGLHHDKPYVYYDATDRIWRVEWHQHWVYARFLDWPTAYRWALRIARRQVRDS